jgi:hypothetical protein
LEVAKSEQADPICKLVNALRQTFKYEGGVIFRPLFDGRIQVLPSFHITLFPVMEAENELMSTGSAPLDPK